MEIISTIITLYIISIFICRVIDIKFMEMGIFSRLSPEIWFVPLFNMIAFILLIIIFAIRTFNLDKYFDSILNSKFVNWFFNNK